MYSKEKILAFEEQIQYIASLSENPSNITRRTYSEAWFSSLIYLSQKMKMYGMNVRVDGIGNLIGTYYPPSLKSEDDVAVVGMGSHIDSVVDAGAFDGVAGVVAALDVARQIYEDGNLKAVFEVVAFAEEEGSRFGIGCLGSRYATGDILSQDIPPEIYLMSNSFNQRFQNNNIIKNNASEDIGWMKDRYSSFLEIHIEQGPILYEKSQTCALVSGVVGIHRMEIAFLGQANHAGTTQMRRRRDSLVMASEFICGCWDYGQNQKNQVITNGKLINFPNEFNVVSGKSEVSVEIRGDDDDLLEQTVCHIRRFAKEIAKKYAGEVLIETLEQIPVRSFDKNLLKGLDISSGGSLPKCMSWADHDTKFVSYVAPAAMLFVPSKDGISHNPLEMSEASDLLKASEIVFRFFKERN